MRRGVETEGGDTLFCYFDLFEEAYGMDGSYYYKCELARGMTRREVLEEIDHMADKAWQEKQKFRQSDGFCDVNLDEIPEVFI